MERSVNVKHGMILAAATKPTFLQLPRLTCCYFLAFPGLSELALAKCLSGDEVALVVGHAARLVTDPEVRSVTHSP